jgi:hypothetical protein
MKSLAVPSAECRDMESRPLRERYQCYHGEDFETINGFYNLDIKKFDDGLTAIVSSTLEAYAYNSYQLNKVIQSEGLTDALNKLKQGIIVHPRNQLNKVVLLASGYRASLAHTDFWKKTEVVNEEAMKVLKASSFLVEKDLAYAHGSIVKLSTYQEPRFFFSKGIA